jgi:hypothetical protein
MNKQEIRRSVIREWMALPRDKRQSAEQTASFAVKTVHRHTMDCLVGAQSSIWRWVYRDREIATR